MSSSERENRDERRDGVHADSLLPQAGLEHAYRDAYAAYRSGDLFAAEKYYRAIIESSPSHHRALNALACLYLVLRRFHEATPLFEQALSNCRTNPVYFNNYGVVLWQASRFKEAKQAFADALELDQNYADAWANFGMTMMSLRENPRNIEQALRRSLELNPRHHDALLHLANLRRRQNRHQDRAELLERLVRLAPENPTFLREAAECYMKIRNFRACSHYRHRVSQIMAKATKEEYMMSNLS